MKTDQCLPVSSDSTDCCFVLNALSSISILNSIYKKDFPFDIGMCVH